MTEAHAALLPVRSLEGGQDMTDKGMLLTARRVTAGLVCIGLTAAIAGCVCGGVRGGPDLADKPSSAEFEVAIDATVPADKRLVVTPNEGDAWIETVATPGTGDNRIVWKSSASFSIKFVQIDDQSRGLSRRLGDERDGWNDAVRDGSGYKYKLALDRGSGGRNKSIRGAKYLVKSPAGCDDRAPGPDCLMLDPVIIVRY